MRSRTGTILVTLVAAMAAASSVSLPSANARSVDPVALTGKMRIHGTEPAGMRVQLDDPIDIGYESDDRGFRFLDGLRINSSSRVAGFMLASPNVTENTTENWHFLSAWRVRRCNQLQCDEDDFRHVYGSHDTEEGNGKGIYRLPAGEYLLYLFTDGSPVTVTLPLPGRGRTVLAPGSPIDFSVVTPTPETTTTVAGDRIYWTGDSHDFQGEAAMIFSLLQVEVDAAAVLEYGDCIQSQQDPNTVPRPLTYSSACPLGFRLAYPVVYAPPVAGPLVAPSLWHIGGAGEIGFGRYLNAGAASVEDLTVVTVNVGLDPASLR